MILPPNPIIQKTFDFLSKSIQQTFIAEKDNEGNLNTHLIKKFISMNELIDQTFTTKTRNRQSLVMQSMVGHLVKSH